MQNDEKNGLTPYLSVWAVLALSFGYAVGWGAFVMPGRVFLPSAGPLGTVIGIVVGALAMGIFALNYHRMVLRGPDPGGAYGFARKAFGADHGFFVSWFLCLTYIAILWANATSVILFARYLGGDALQFGFHYKVVGFDVYFGEVMLCVFVIVAVGIVSLCCRRLVAHLQMLLAAVFIAGVAVCFFAALSRREGSFEAFAPAFAPDRGGMFYQILAVVAMMPWAFVGFEAVSNSSAEFKFDKKKLLPVFLVSIVFIAAIYSALALLPAIVVPESYSSWSDYLAHLSTNGSAGLTPVFVAARLALGPAGSAILGGALVAAQLTGIFATYVALSRLMYSMAHNGVLPSWFGALSRDGTPRNAIFFIMCASVAVPFFGRTAIAWPIDVSSIGATIAYAYTSVAAFKAMGSNRRKEFWVKLAGLGGAILAGLLCLMMLIPNYLSGSSLAPESYLLLALWCILGFLAYRRAFLLDCEDRFGHTPVVWIGLLVLIFFSSLMWVRQAVCNATDDVVHRVVCDGMSVERLEQEVHSINETTLRNSLIEMSLLVVSLLIMLSLFSHLRKRERDMAVEKAEAERVNKAKSYFFSTVSHDIRTPLNAILGFSQMLKLGFKTEVERNQAIDAILVSGKTLLCLINDVLDLSKLESGKMSIEPEAVDVKKLLGEIVDSFRMASQKQGLDIRGKVDGMPPLMLDPQRIRQIAFNLMGNASKFTHDGHIELRASFAPDGNGETGTFALDVEDTGCGISEEDQKKIASPYVQVGSKASRNGGTGLGLAICRQLAKAMGGDMALRSELGKGSTFSIIVPGVKICDKSEIERSRLGEVNRPRHGAVAAIARKKRILAADDQKINIMLLKAMLAKIGGCELVTAINGKEALDILKTQGAGSFDMVFTDMWMPEMDGRSLVRTIRADPSMASIPVYVMTADVDMRDTFTGMGFTGLLLKPVTIENLKEVIGL